MIQNDDTISRQAVLDVMNGRIETIKQTWGRKVKKGEIAMYLDMRGIVEMFPSAQSEIIRCKDCKYMTEHYDTDGNVPYWTCSEWDSGTDYDGFCHYAERWEDG